MRFRTSWLLALVALSAQLVMACAASEQDIQRLAREQAATIVANALTVVPTPTPIQFPTPLPTATPFPTPGPAVGGPIVFPPTPTPQPTATPFPTATPQPTATPIVFPPTPTPIPLALVSDFNALYREWSPSVFWIEAGFARGTGWLLEPGFIVTSEHVVAGRSTVTVRLPGLPQFLALVLASDSVRDVALVQYPTNTVFVGGSAKPFNLGDIDVEDAASPLIALGYPDNVEVMGNGTVGPVSANVGSMAGVVTLRSYLDVVNIVMDAAVDPGDSGAPVLDVNGELVGMVRTSFGAGSGRHVGANYSVHVDEIRAALPDLKNGVSR